MSSQFYSKLKGIVSVIILIDILILPSINIPFLPSVPISLPIVLLIVFLNYKKLIKYKSFKLFLILIISLIFSFFVSLAVSPKFTYLNQEVVSVIEHNIKRPLEMILLFSYYFFYKLFFKNSKYIVRVLILFIVWYLFLGLLAVIDLKSYAAINELIYGDIIYNKEYLIQNNLNALFRFNYFFVDPNTAVYMFLLVAFFTLTKYKLNLIMKLIIHFGIIFAVIISQSSGGLISALLFYGVYFTKYIINSINKPVINKNNIFILNVSLLLLIIFIMFMLIRTDFSISNIEFIDAAIKRIVSNTDGGGRLDMYLYLLSDRLPFIWGEGFVLIRNGIWYKPHSDILRFLYSYGIVSLLSFIFIFTKEIKMKNYFLIPAIIAMLINTLIGEQKLFAIFLILTSISIESSCIISENTLSKD